MTANDSDVSDGDILTGSQVVRVYGKNLTAPFVTLTFGDVEYTPLVQGEGYIEYLLGDNGTATINVDGSPIMSFEVGGIVVPSVLPNRLLMAQVQGSSDIINPRQVQSGNCINYPFVYNASYPVFRLGCGEAEREWRDNDPNSWEGVNCTLRYVLPAGAASMYVRAELIDYEAVAYIKYKGFIVAVFNYTTD